MNEYVDLLMDNNEIVRIEYTGEDIDGFYESLVDAEKRKDSWSVEMFSEASAKCNGIRLTRINMSKVIGWL